MNVLRSLAVILIALLGASLLPPLQRPAVAAERASGNIVANEVRHEDPARRGEIAPLDGGETVSITSEVVDAGQRFNYVGVHWRVARGKESSVLVEARWSGDGDAWSDWRLLAEEEDMTDEVTNELYAAPIGVGDARYAQYRIWSTDGDLAAPRSVALSFMDVSDLNESPLVRLRNDFVGAWKDFAASFSATAASSPARVLTRQDWAASESLMEWIPEYVPWKKAVVHHTVTSNSYSSAAPEIRSIYHYHAITRGWGDIGYNYLVDRFGNIWIGRQGGDDTVGGHAYGWNQGSMGVAALGSFTTTSPSAAQLNGLAQIIAMKLKQRGIQPFGADVFTHKEEDRAGNWQPITSSPPNVLGHRDCSYVIGVAGGQTSCPGNALYGQLNTVRQMAQNLVNAGYNDLVLMTPAMPRVANTGSTISVPVVVKNVGVNALSASNTKVSYRILNAQTGATVVGQGPLVSLATSIPAGGEQIVAVNLAVPAVGQYIVRWDLYQVGAGWFSTVKGTPFRDQWLAAVEWDVTWVSDNAPATMSVGQNVTVSVTMKNTGARAWPASNVRLSYHWISDVTQRTVVWNGNRGSLPGNVNPGQQVSVPVTVTAPTFPTRYRLEFDLVYEGSFWFSEKGVETLAKTVNVPFDFKATYTVPQTLTLTPDQKATVPVTIRNTGTSPWPASGSPFVELGTHWYTPTGAQVEWDGARTVLPKAVNPGESVTVQANVDAPSAPGTYQLRFDLALEGVSWFSAKGVAPGVTNVTVRLPTYGAQYVPGILGGFLSAPPTSVPMAIKNTSDFAWTSPAFNLAFHVRDAAGRLIVWDGARTALPGTVAPGQTVNVQARLALPANAGNYVVEWDMVHEGVTWFSGKGVPVGAQAIMLGTPTYSASYDTSLTPANMATRLTTRVLVTVRNGSNFPYATATNVYLSYHWLSSSGAPVIWDGKRSPLNVPAGATGQVWVDVVGPPTPGAYRLAFDLVHEGIAWFSSKGVPMSTRAVNVVAVPYGALYSGVPVGVEGAAGATITVPVTVTNTGTRSWTAGKVNLAYHIYLNGQPFVWDGLRTALPALGREQSATVMASVKLPATAREYEIRFDVVEEGVTWFSGQGVPTGNLLLTVR